MPRRVNVQRLRGQPAEWWRRWWIWPIVGCASLPGLILLVAILLAIFVPTKEVQQARKPGDPQGQETTSEDLDEWRTSYETRKAFGWPTGATEEALFEGLDAMGELADEMALHKYRWQQYDWPLIKDIPAGTRGQIARELAACVERARITADATLGQRSLSDAWFEVKETEERRMFGEVAAHYGITLQQAYAIDEERYYGK